VNLNLKKSNPKLEKKTRPVIGTDFIIFSLYPQTQVPWVINFKNFFNNSKWDINDRN
jgi:hypothetical protein